MTITWFTLQIIIHAHRQTTILVANNTISRGTTLTRESITTQTIPYSDNIAGGIQSVDEIVGSVATITIEKNMPIYATMIAKISDIHNGDTIIDITTATTQSALHPGEIVALVAAKSCDELHIPTIPDEQSKEQTHSDIKKHQQHSTESQSDKKQSNTNKNNGQQHEEKNSIDITSTTTREKNNTNKTGDKSHDEQQNNNKDNSYGNNAENAPTVEKSSYTFAKNTQEFKHYKQNSEANAVMHSYKFRHYYVTHSEQHTLFPSQKVNSERIVQRTAIRKQTANTQHSCLLSNRVRIYQLPKPDNDSVFSTHNGERNNMLSVALSTEDAGKILALPAQTPIIVSKNS